MKRFFLILTAVCLLLSLCACGAELPTGTGEEGTELRIGERTEMQVNTLKGAEMELVEGSLTAGRMTVQVLNDSNVTLASGNAAFFAIQVWQEDGWYELEPEPITGTTEALLFQKDEPREMTFSWAARYGQLPPGRYRLVKYFFDMNKTENEYMIGLEFELV